MLPQPKFSIGQTVYSYATHHGSERWPCPDCKDTRIWTATSPAGETFPVSCLRCCGSYTLPKDLPPLQKTKITTSIEIRTIGSVQIDTAHEPERQIQYMCRETGVGSGRVYPEGGRHGLFATEAEAQAQADLDAAAKQQVIDAAPRTLKAIDFSGLPIRLALPRDWRGEIWNAWNVARDYREVLDEILTGEIELETAQERAREVIEAQERRGSWRDPHPLDRLLKILGELPMALPMDLADAIAALTYRPGEKGGV